MREDPTSYEVADGELTITTTEGDIYQTPNAAGGHQLRSCSPTPTLPADYIDRDAAVGDVHRRLRPGGPARLRRRRQLRQARRHLRRPAQGRINRVELRSESDGAIQQPAAPGRRAGQRHVVPPAADQGRGRATSVRSPSTAAGWQPVGTVDHPTADMDFGVFALGVQQAGPDRDVRLLPGHPGRSREPAARRRRRHRHHAGGHARSTSPVLAGDTDPDGDTSPSRR